MRAHHLDGATAAPADGREAMRRRRHRRSLDLPGWHALARPDGREIDAVAAATGNLTPNQTARLRAMLGAERQQRSVSEAYARLWIPTLCQNPSSPTLRG